MKDIILGILAICSWVLVISVIYIIRYILLKRELKLVYEEYEEKIHEALRGNRIRFSAFFLEPQESGDGKIDLLLFKLHRSVMWAVLLIIFYLLSAVSLCLFFLCVRR